MNQEIDTFESICAGRGEPIEVFDIVSPPERDIRCGKFIPSPDPVRVGIWKLPSDIEGGLMVCGTYHTGAPLQWHYNCGERSAVAHLLADRDRLRSELDAIAKERSGPHCLRCRNAAVCSTRDDDRSIPLCVADPEGSMPLWDPVTLADVQAVVSELDAACVELARVRRQLLRRMEIGVFRIWGGLPPGKQSRRHALRLQKFQCACRAERSRMEAES